MLDEHWDDQPTPKDVPNEPAIAKAGYFTLDPAYAHYELGDVEMEYETVYGRPDSGVSEAAVWALNGAFVMLVLCSQNGVFTFVVWIAFILGVGAYDARISTRLKEQAELKLQKLRQMGILLDGILVKFEIVNEFHLHKAYVSARQPYAKVTFQFETPDKRTVYAEQRRRLLDKQWRHSIPPYGTPIRVLYADPETYVML